MKVFRVLIVLVVAGAISCKSPHKLFEVEHVDLSAGSIGSVHREFPQEVIDSLGWGNLESMDLRKTKEEFRLTISSSTIPSHLFRIEKGRKVNGEIVLFWQLSDSADVFLPHENMLDYLKETCSEILETPNYNYCKPELSYEIDWNTVYDTFEQNNIWTIPDMAQMDVPETHPDYGWNINVQVRLKDYYRTYHHQSPDQYGGTPDAVNILAISSRLGRITDNLLPSDNFNTYTGITTGVKGAPFIVCDNDEIWRFNGSLNDLLTEQGFFSTSSRQDSLLFFVSLNAMVEDEWYSLRETTGFTKVITPSELKSITTVSKAECPGR